MKSFFEPQYGKNSKSNPSETGGPKSRNQVVTGLVRRRISAGMYVYHTTARKNLGSFQADGIKVDVGRGANALGKGFYTTKEFNPGEFTDRQQVDLAWEWGLHGKDPEELVRLTQEELPIVLEIEVLSKCHGYVRSTSGIFPPCDFVHGREEICWQHAARLWIRRYIDYTPEELVSLTSKIHLSGQMNLLKRMGILTDEWMIKVERREAELKSIHELNRTKKKRLFGMKW
ncbi:hypothetical protein LY474_00770 [Myxococcus stipitatus]|uniref:hypothetical protein n=1 Tax=Myxococcus stipitatus TaxID=83455 RepID=UPI001F3A4A79|nr:hypothetical protein [Myxococcus stipitatus]MCE9666329.1 hypothetical protein [Myxococcus stipitatus]